MKAFSWMSSAGRVRARVPFSGVPGAGRRSGGAGWRALRPVSLVFLSLLLAGMAGTAAGQTVTQEFDADGEFVVLGGTSEVTVRAWGAGGAGGGRTSSGAAGGGGGGAFAVATIPVNPGDVLMIRVAGSVSGTTGNGANGEPSYVMGPAGTIVVRAAGGSGGLAAGAGGAGGSAALSLGDTIYEGGQGANAADGNGGGGGGGAGTTGAGGNAAAISGGDGTAVGGGDGGDGRTSNGNGNPGSIYGGGGGGARRGTFTNRSGGAGAAGRVTVEFAVDSTAEAVAFASPPRTTYPNSRTRPISVSLVGENGNPVAAPVATTIDLSSSLPGVFRDLADTTDITSVTIPAGQWSASFRYRTAELGIHELTASADGLGAATQELRVNRFPGEVQTYYLPLPPDQLLTSLNTIASQAVSPVQMRAVITASSDDTIIYYDPMESPYEIEISNPANIYHPVNNPSGVQIWGDGDPTTGHPPGIPDDIINAGTVIRLESTLASPFTPNPNNPSFRGGDKFAATRGIAITWAGWCSGANTLLAGALEVYDTRNWGTEYLIPVGVNIHQDRNDAIGDMFQYTGATIMAGRSLAGTTTVQIDLNGNGVFDQTVTLAEGEAHLVNNGLHAGGRIVSDVPVQVDLITGDIDDTYESRFFRLLPTDLWASSYFTPVSTPPSAQGIGGTKTTVWLYNPNPADITVTYRRRDPGLTASSITVPAGGYREQVIPDGTGAHFFTDTEEPFYAVSTTDSTGWNRVGGATDARNRAWDWGFSLVPETSLTPQFLVGLGIGRDPTSAVNPDENGNPVWVSTVGNGDTLATVYIDYQDGTPPAGFDPHGFPYHDTRDLRELEHTKIYNPSGDQTGMLVYTLDLGVRLFAAWGQDPLAASAGAPGLDVGTGIPPLPRFSAVKRAMLIADNDGDGWISPGDDIEYIVEITNISRSAIEDVTLEDTLPLTQVDYLPGTTFFTDEFGVTEQIDDNPADPVFPLTPPGVLLPRPALDPGQTWTVSYDVRLKPFEDLPKDPEMDTFINAAIVNSLAVDDPIFLEDDEPIYGRIGDFAWIDLNGDGIQDPGEPGLAGVTVNLYNGDDVLLATTETDATGFYWFTGLLRRDYRVEFVPPPGFAFTTFDANSEGLRDEVNSDADPATGSTIVFTLGVGEPLMQVDAGFVAAATIGDRVWLDENADGVQDAGEDGIANVTVRLLDAGDNVVATTVTDTEGNYLFRNVAPGTYAVQVDPTSLPAGLAANPTYDEDGTVTPHISAVTVVAGQTHLTADFGYNWAPPDDVFDPGPGATGAIGDRIWVDANGDGVQDPGEPGLAGVTVRLLRDTNGNGVYDDELATTTTDAAGNYIFDNLPAGAYVVEVVPPANYTQTGDPDHFGAAASTNPDEAGDNRTTTPVILAPGDVFVNADFGYQPDTADLDRSLGGKVYLDANADEAFDAADGDYGIPGVTVALLDDAGNVIATTRTDADGNYTFTGLQDGETYEVWVNDIGNLLGGLAQTEDPDAVKDDRTTVAVGGADVTGLDFGYTPPGHSVNTGLIGDRIWLDIDGDGAQDAGEPGLQGVRVNLFDATGTTLLATTVTDANGNYWIGGLSTDDATYIVSVDTSTLPNGGVGLDNTGVPPGGSNSESTVTLTAAEPVRLDQDFGYFAAIANTIGGTIWEDRNADGTLDGAEDGRFEGVTVVLRDANGHVVGTTTTAADGSYSFAGLPDGTYTVAVTDEAKVLRGYWHSKGEEGDGTADGTTAGQSQPDPYTVSVSGAAGRDATVDFGYYVEGASVGNRVWLDVNANGRQDPGESGIAGVLVRLTINYANGDTSVVTTVSGANGFYRFGNLLLDENHRGAVGDGSPELVLSVVNPNNPNYPYHTNHNAPGVPESLNSVHPLGTVATVLQGQTDVSAQANPADESPNAWFDFGFTPEPTAAVISAVRASVADGVVVVSWDVAEEFGTAGYYLERWTDGEWVRINADLIPSDDFAIFPVTYEQADPGVPLTGMQRYRIVELDHGGGLVNYGPYDLAVDGGAYDYDTWAAGIEWGDADSSPNADPDGDGMTNFQEYLAGTNPLEANSVLRITRMTPVADGMALTWNSEPGRVYRVEIASSLTGPYWPWPPLGSEPIEATPPENTYVVPLDLESVPRAYFRIRLAE